MLMETSARGRGGFSRCCAASLERCVVRERPVIRGSAQADPHRLLEWGVAASGRRVMVRCLHGFGDAVQMLRLLPLLRELAAAHVVVQVAPMPGAVGTVSAGC